MPRVLAHIGQVRPEPQSSAAGIRAQGMSEAFRSGGWDVRFLGPEEARPNDPEFDRLIARLAPDAVLFDRFHIEERFGWRVARAVPGAARILDTVELHGLTD